MSELSPTEKKRVVVDAEKKLAEENMCIQILQKDPQDRTPEDVNTVYSWVTQLNCSFFEDYSEGVVKDLCQCMKYESIPAGTTLFKQDDDSSKFYIIVHGSVSVRIISHEDSEYPTDRATAQQIKQLQNTNVLNAMSTPSMMRMKIENRVAPKHNAVLTINPRAEANDSPTSKSRIMTNPGSPKREKPRTLGFQPKPQQEIFVGLLRAGGPTTSFGELGLISDKKRSATIRTELEDSQFLTLEKADFDRVLKARTHEILTEKVNVLKQLPILANVSDDHLIAVALHLKKRMLTPQQSLHRDGTPATHIYFLVRGSLGAYKKKPKPITSTDSPTNTTNKVAHDPTKRHKIKEAQNELEQISAFEEGAVIAADEALAEPMKMYPYTIRSNTECVIFQIQREDLLQRVRLPADRSKDGATEEKDDQGNNSS